MSHNQDNEKLYVRAIFSITEELSFLKDTFKFSDIKATSLLLDLILEHVFNGRFELNVKNISIFTPHLDVVELERCIPEIKICIDQIYDKITALSPDIVPLKDKIYHVYDGGAFVLIYVPYNETRHHNVNRSTLLSENAINCSIRAHSRHV